MGNIKIIKGVFDTKLELEHAGIKAGFPSPADDYRHETIDRINRMHGSETIVIGAQQYTQKNGKGKAAIEREQSQACLGSAERKQARPKVKAEVFANAIKHDFRSKNPTTRWSDIIKLK